MPRTGWFSKNGSKFLWAIIPTVVGSALTAVIIQWIQNRSPELVVRQFYNQVENSKSVPDQIGGLILDYQPDPPRNEYVVEVANIGRGPEEDLRLQVRFPNKLTIGYSQEPNFKIFRPEEMTLRPSDFFMSLKQFPRYAVAPVAFSVQGETSELCGVQVQVAGREKVGRVEALKGVTCQP